MEKLTRRQFLKMITAAAAVGIMGPWPKRPIPAPVESEKIPPTPPTKGLISIPFFVGAGRGV